MSAKLRPTPPADLKESSRENRHIREEEAHGKLQKLASRLHKVDPTKFDPQLHDVVPRLQPGNKISKKKAASRTGGSSDAVHEPKGPFPKQKQPHPGLEAKLEPKPRYFGAEYRPADKLEDKVALITGGDSGIGRSVAVLYAREGADVAIIYLPEEQKDAEHTQRVIEEQGRRCLLLPGDVTNFNFCSEAVERTVAELGKLDILVNNAAFQQNVPEIEDLTIEQFEKTFRTNIFGYFYMVKAALNHLPEGGTIINTGSETGLQGSKDLLDYSATKGAIHAFTKSLSQNLEKRNIRVNCVAPGPIWTVLQVVAKEPKESSEHGKKTPMGRAGQPEEVAPAYVFLASNADSSYISGEIIRILGGLTMAG
jgi:NAD(P)-dependent dehydrogenase (short-subunit alcohol dehydrogenase family)